MAKVDYSASAIESRLAICGQLHRLGTSLRDARSRPGVERPVYETIVRSVATRFREIEDLDSTRVWTAAVYLALGVDARQPVARSLGLAAAELNAPCDPEFDFSWVERARPSRRLLVAESELGKTNHAGANDSEVRKDFARLLSTDAAYRVLVYAAHERSRTELEGWLGEQARASAAPSSFLFLGIDWQRVPIVEGTRAWWLRAVGGVYVRETLPIPST